MPPDLELTLHIKHRSFTYRLRPGQVMRLGRGADVDIQVDDESVSRMHLELRVEGSRLDAEDLGSFNGSEVLERGQSQKRIRLRPGHRTPFRIGDTLRMGSVRATLSNAREISMRGDQVTCPPPSSLGRILVDPGMQQLYELAKRAAASDIGILILGETGVGKELLAAHVHESSPRSAKRLVQVNCGSVTETLLESQLFGHEKGAFTGAHALRPGLFETCSGGTVFLDEIGEMPLASQVKLLRVLEERAITRLGSTTKIPIDVRIVAATNRDLLHEVAQGRFREDLYYRLSGIVVHVPPLRERPSEIEPLARHFLRVFCLESAIALPELTPSALDWMRSYRWPGNVRELKNTMERAPFLSAGAPILAEHLDNTPKRTRTSPLRALFHEEDAQEANGFEFYPTRPRWPIPDSSEPRQEIPSRAFTNHPHRDLPLTGFPTRVEPRSNSGHENARLTHRSSSRYSEEDERGAVLQALEACSGNQTRAAEMLGVSRRTLINRIEAFGLPRPRKKSRSR